MVMFQMLAKHINLGRWLSELGLFMIPKSYEFVFLCKTHHFYVSGYSTNVLNGNSRVY